MDRLRSEGLLSRQEYGDLQAVTTEEERTRKLINDILPRKGSDSFTKFCEVLRTTEGQEHVVNDIIQPLSQTVGGAVGPQQEVEDKFASRTSQEEHQRQTEYGQKQIREVALQQAKDTSESELRETIHVSVKSIHQSFCVAN